MISIIICSKQADITPEFKENIKTTIGVDYELVVIDNSQSTHTIFSAYNFGLTLSKYPNVCFVHEDVLFRTEKWGSKLIKHLSSANCGLVGIAGGKLMATVPDQWSDPQSFMNVIQYNNKKKTSKLISKPANFSNTKTPVVLLDGVFLAAQKQLFNIIKFDESFNGFHGYDYDISVQVFAGGFTNFVVYDIILEHFSIGKKNSIYYQNLLKVYAKWEHLLPLYADDYQSNVLGNLNSYENVRLKKLVRRLAKNSFSTNEIVNYYCHYRNELKLKGIAITVGSIRLRIAFAKFIAVVNSVFRVQ